MSIKVLLGIAPRHNLVANTFESILRMARRRSKGAGREVMLYYDGTGIETMNAFYIGNLYTIMGNTIYNFRDPAFLPKKYAPMSARPMSIATLSLTPR